MIQIVESNYQNGHGDIIIRLMNAYAAELSEDGKPLSEFTQKNLIHELAAKRGGHTVLAFADGDPAGFGISFEAFSTFACRPILNIHDLYVAPAFRGKGLSKLLLAELEKIALNIGCCKLTLEVLENNTAGRALYDSFGFRSYELDPVYGKALFLEKKL